jgi:hypothetical protein
MNHNTETEYSPLKLLAELVAYARDLKRSHDELALSHNKLLELILDNKERIGYEAGSPSHRDVRAAIALRNELRASIIAPASPAVTAQLPAVTHLEPCAVFDHGPWLFEETGQRFTGADLDAAAFSVYRAAAPTPDKIKLRQRCDIALQCVPDAPYRQHLSRLFDDLLAASAPVAGSTRVYEVHNRFFSALFACEEDAQKAVAASSAAAGLMVTPRPVHGAPPSHPDEISVAAGAASAPGDIYFVTQVQHRGVMLVSLRTDEQPLRAKVGDMVMLHPAPDMEKCAGPEATFTRDATAVSPVSRERLDLTSPASPQCAGLLPHSFVASRTK